MGYCGRRDDVSTHFRIARVMPRYVTSNSTGSDYWAVVLADSPWGAWKTDETSGSTLADASGNSRPLSISGTPTLAQTGPDGVSADAIAWPNSNVYASSSANFPTSGGTAATLECWVYLPAAVAAITPLMNLTNGSTSTEMVMFFDATGKLNLRTYHNGSFLINALSALTAGWHHVVGSVGAAGLKLRVDGTTVASSISVNAAGDSGQSNVPLMLHGHGSYANANGNGPITMARAAAWNSQLSDAQTDAHYAAI